MPEITMTNIFTFDIIEYQGVRYRIDKINPKNYKMTRENDGRSGFILPQTAYGIKRAENQDWAGPKEKTELEKWQEAQAAGLVLGSTVKLTHSRLTAKYGTDQVWVVIAKANDGTMRITKLGGWGDTYLRKIEATQVQVVNV